LDSQSRVGPVSWRGGKEKNQKSEGGKKKSADRKLRNREGGSSSDVETEPHRRGSRASRCEPSSKKDRRLEKGEGGRETRLLKERLKRGHHQVGGMQRRGAKCNCIEDRRSERPRAVMYRAFQEGIASLRKQSYTIITLVPPRRGQVKSVCKGTKCKGEGSSV